MKLLFLLAPANRKKLPMSCLPRQKGGKLKQQLSGKVREKEVVGEEDSTSGFNKLEEQREEEMVGEEENKEEGVGRREKQSVSLGGSRQWRRVRVPLHIIDSTFNFPHTW